MKRLLPLMQREWLQHRFGWSLVFLIPLGLGLALTSFGSIDIGPDTVDRVGEHLPTLVALATMGGTMVTLFLTAWVSSLIIVSGIARRDHGDRSIEFWMSLPATHSESLAAPLIVHLLLVPMAALVLGLLGGWLVSMVVVTRVSGFGAWLALPWPQLLAASVSLTARFVAGLPLATLWLLPLLMLVVLLSAWFRRWAWVILAVGIGLGSQILDHVFGQPLLRQWLKSLFTHAAQAMVASERGFPVHPAEDITGVLSALPGWTLHDLGLALANLASPLMAGGLLFAAACFALLVLWRQRGAGLAG
jgi:ABC-2 type transport system permease protein